VSARRFRDPDSISAPDKSPRLPPMPPLNRPPVRTGPSAVVRRAVAIAKAREEGAS
jgi:hypothetical protein